MESFNVFEVEVSKSIPTFSNFSTVSCKDFTIDAPCRRSNAASGNADAILCDTAIFANNINYIIKQLLLQQVYWHLLIHIFHNQKDYLVHRVETKVSRNLMTVHHYQIASF
jgi:hypothetical protein